MIRLLFILLLLSFRAMAASTNIPVDITITHPNPGGIITTSTWTNYSGSTMPAGTPVHFAQAWRYDDIRQGSFPAVQDAATHTPLVYQWDNIDTAHENGGDGSWKHSVGIAKLAAPLANGASVTFEFPLVSGTYSQAQAVPLSNLCSGANAHALKIHLTDVRNQDDSTRVTGDATFDLCANINNTGRDAPRIVGSGSIRTEVQIMGQFVYTNSTKDPLLYVLCDVGLYATGETEWVCHVMSPWMNVAAGSSGNAGAPGPVGLANDPQIISYRAAVLDGSTNVLDWSNFDATLQSPNSPVISCPDNYGGGAGACLNVPSSTGANSWYWPQTVRVTSCTGTCVGGLTQGQLAWVYPSGIAAARAFTNTTSTSINLLASPEVYGPAAGSSVLSTSQGTGSTTFQHRIWHVKWASWETMDTTADENWSLPSGTTRVTRRFYPHLASAEQTYWEQTGLVPPILLSQTIANNIDYGQTASPPFYAPLARMNVIGLGGPGFRHDIGIITDFASAAFVTQAQNDWYLARLYTMGTPFHGWMGVLNEVTGRIPPMNNGPPGAGGFGTGASYSQLGAPFPALRFPSTTGGNMVQPLQNVPNANFAWDQGMWGLNGTGVDHTPAFGSLTYIMWGEQQFLEMLRWNANHDIYQSPTYAIEPQNLNYAVRDTQVTPGPGQGHAYYCNVLYQNQNRGSAWTLRDITLPAALGSDSDQERIYYNDCITEMANSYPAINAFIDGSAQGTPLESSLIPPNFGGSGGTWDAIDVFIGDYMFLATYQMQTFLHSPMAAAWIPKFTRWYQGLLGGGTVAGSLDPFYGIDFSASPAVRNGDCVMNGSVTGGDVGKCLNAVDASDYGGFGHYTTFTAGSGQLQQRLNAPTYTLQVGDTIKYQGVMSYSTTAEAIDQLPGNQWFKVLGPIDNNNGTYFVENPATPGTPFSQFTRNGTTFNELNGAVIYRPTFVPPPATQGFFNSGYCVYARETLAGLNIFGQDVKAPLNNFTFRVGGDINNCVNAAVVAFDQTIVVPGSSSQPGPTPPSPPAPAVLAGFTTLAMNSDWTVQMPLGWLGGCPNGANLGPPLTASQDNSGHTWWINLWWFSPDPYGVCNIGQITDPNFGGLTLDIPWTLNISNPDGSGNFNWTRGNAMQTASRDFDNVNFNPPRGQSNDFPNNAYYEVVMRMTPQVQASFGAFNTWVPDAISTQAKAGVEDDVIELDSGNVPASDAAVHNWQTGPTSFGVWGAGAPAIPSLDTTQYHAFGMLTTSDGNDMSFCAYVDNVLINHCQLMSAVGGGLTALEKTQRQFLILQNFCDSWNYDQTIPCGGRGNGARQDQYVRTARVWSCPTWATTQCLRSLITNPTASISSIKLANNSTTTGLSSGTAVGTFSVTMNPATVMFFYSGTNLHLSTSGSDSGGVCNTTNGAGNGSFQIINSDTLATNGSPTAGNKAICVAASQSGVSAAGQAFTITVGNRIDAATGVGTGGCTGNGSSGSPWNYLCIQNAVNKAVSGDTVFLRGGNWTLNTGDATYVTINKQINLTGAGSGNTFDSYGHITNLEYTDQCPTSGTAITCINQVGTAYGPNDTTLQGGTTPSAGLLFFGSTSGQSATCANVTVSHIFFDGSHTTDGGNNAALVSGMNCLGPITFNDIRLLTWTGANGNAETQFQMTAINTPVAGYPSTCPAPGTQGVNIYNSFFGEPNNTSFTNVNQDQLNYVETVNNSVFWQFVANPIDIDCFTFTGNTTVNTAGNWEAEFGVTGFLLLAPGANLAPSNPVNNGGNGFLGNFHYFVRNNYFNSAGEALGVGSGVNDANTNGAVSDFHYTGNWIVATTGSLDSCSWRPRIPTEDCSGAMVINAQPSSSCVLSSNGYPFEITNNSIIASASAQLNALAGSGNQIRCYQTGQSFPNGTLTQIKVFGYNATKNYLNSPSNKYNTDAFSISPAATGNFCVGSTFTQSDSTTCATTGFTTLPTVSFTPGLLNSGVMPISSPSFSAQYGAVKWIASTSSTTPTSGDTRWSFTPPVSLSSVAHGNTVYLWGMDSANNISSPASAVVP